MPERRVASGRLANPRRWWLVAMMAVSVVVAGYSCTGRAMTREALQQYIRKNAGLSKEEEVRGIKVRCSYMPGELLLQQELTAVPKGDTARPRVLKEKYAGQYYFQLSYSKNNKEVIRQLGSYARYSDMVQVMSFEMGAHINATDERHDTLTLADYLFSQEYGMSSANNMLLVFRRSDFDKAKTIVITISEFGLDIGETRFEFRKSELEDVPRLAGL